MDVSHHISGMFELNAKGSLPEGRRIRRVLERTLAELSFDEIDVHIIKSLLLHLPALEEREEVLGKP